MWTNFTTSARPSAGGATGNEKSGVWLLLPTAAAVYKWLLYDSFPYLADDSQPLIKLFFFLERKTTNRPFLASVNLSILSFRNQIIGYYRPRTCLFGLIFFLKKYMTAVFRPREGVFFVNDRVKCLILSSKNFLIEFLLVDCCFVSLIETFQLVILNNLSHLTRKGSRIFARYHWKGRHDLITFFSGLRFQLLDH